MLLSSDAHVTCTRGLSASAHLVFFFFTFSELTIARRRYRLLSAVIAIIAVVIIWRILAIALFVSSRPLTSQGSCASTMSLSSLSRARAAVLGSFVADAATVGVHWIYDQSKVKKMTKDSCNTKSIAPHRVAHFSFFALSA
jgi:hypothetical protein